jgi:hypothetical protein
MNTPTATPRTDYHAAHLKHAEAQINGAADWHKRTGGTLPAKLSCYEAVALHAELARLRAAIDAAMEAKP